MTSVLVVDDSPPVRKLLGTALRLRGFEVFEAAHGIEAIHLAGSRNPSVILMDIRMPGLDGFQTTALLKANPDTSPIPVVAVTGVRLRGETDRVDSFGFEGYVTKPLRLGVLVSLVERLAESSPLQPAG